MDPDATLADIVECYQMATEERAKGYDKSAHGLEMEARDHLYDLRDWMKRGGFPPNANPQTVLAPDWMNNKTIQLSFSVYNVWKARI